MTLTIKCPHCLKDQQFTSVCNNCEGKIFDLYEERDFIKAQKRKTFYLKEFEYIFTSLGVWFFGSMIISFVAYILVLASVISEESRRVSMIYALVILISTLYFIIKYFYNRNKIKSIFNFMCNQASDKLSKILFERICHLDIDKNIIKNIENNGYKRYLAREINCDLLYANVSYKSAEDIMEVFSTTSPRKLREPIIIPKDVNYETALGIIIGHRKNISRSYIAYMVFNTIFSAEIKRIILEVSEHRFREIENVHEYSLPTLKLDSTYQ
jgi:hypothetical protein